MEIKEWALIQELFTSDSADEIYDFFEPEFLEDSMCREFYKVLAEENDHNEKHDFTTVVEKLKSKGFTEYEILKPSIELKEQGQLLSIQVVQFAKTLAGRHQAKRVVDILKKDKITASNVFDVIDRIQTELQEIKAPTQDGMSLGDMVDEFADLYFREKPPYKFRTNYQELDKAVRLEGGDMVIIAACSGTGKSALALNFAINMAFNGVKVAYFNLEMSNKSMFERIVARLLEMELGTFRNSTSATRQSLERFAKVKEKMREKKDNFRLYTGGYSCSQIRQVIRKTKPEIVFIDYLQLVTPSDRYKGNKAAEVSEVSRTIKNMATQFEIPIVGLSQFHRISDYDEPVKTDLKESGSLENDASVVLLMWKTDEENENARCLKVDKNRNGANKKIMFDFSPAMMTFTESGDFHKASTKEQDEMPDIFKDGA